MYVPRLFHLAILKSLQLLPTVVNGVTLEKHSQDQSVLLFSSMIDLQKERLISDLDINLMDEFSFFQVLQSPYSFSPSLNNAIRQCMQAGWLLSVNAHSGRFSQTVLNLRSDTKLWISKITDNKCDLDHLLGYWVGIEENVLHIFKNNIVVRLHNFYESDAIGKIRELLPHTLIKMANYYIWEEKKFSNRIHFPIEQWCNASQAINRETGLYRAPEEKSYRLNPAPMHLIVILAARELYGALEKVSLEEESGWNYSQTFYRYLFESLDELRRKGYYFNQFWEIMRPGDTLLDKQVVSRSLDAIIRECRFAGWLERSQPVRFSSSGFYGYSGTRRSHGRSLGGAILSSAQKGGGQTHYFPIPTDQGYKLLNAERWTFQRDEFGGVVELNTGMEDGSGEQVPLIGGLVEETLRYFAHRVSRMDHPGELSIWVQRSASRIVRDRTLDPHLYIHGYYRDYHSQNYT